MMKKSLFVVVVALLTVFAFAVLPTRMAHAQSGLQPPANLSATYAVGVITVGWDAVAGATSYDVGLRQVAAPLWTTTNATTTTFSTSTAATGVVWEVRVRARSGNAASAYTDSVAVSIPFTDNQLRSLPFLTVPPQAKLVLALRGEDFNAGRRWQVEPAPPEDVLLNTTARPGWRAEVFATSGAALPSFSVESHLDANDTLACGGAGFVRGHDASLCIPAIAGEVLTAELIRFTAFVYRATDGRRFYSTHHADTLITPDTFGGVSGPFSTFTLTLPVVEHIYEEGLLTLSIRPVRGSDLSEVLINGRQPLYVYSTPRAGEDGVTYTRWIQIPDTPGSVSYAVRNVARNLTGSPQERVVGNGDETYTVAPYSVAYTPFTLARHVPTGVGKQVMIPPPTRPLVETEFTLTSAIGSFLPHLGRPESEAQVWALAVMVVGSVAIGASLYAMVERTQVAGSNGLGFVVGAVVATVVWVVVGLSFAGIPQYLVAAPLVIPLIALLVWMRRQGG